MIQAFYGAMDGVGASKGVFLTTSSFSKDARDVAMASLTIRNLDGDTKARLRLQAARHGRSMEEEARTILRQRELLGRPMATADAGDRCHHPGPGGPSGHQKRAFLQGLAPQEEWALVLEDEESHEELDEIE